MFAILCELTTENTVHYLLQSTGVMHLIINRVISVFLAQNIPGVVIGMETTSIYVDNLMYYLHEIGSLGRFERRLHMLSPKQI